MERKFKVGDKVKLNQLGKVILSMTGMVKNPDVVAEVAQIGGINPKDEVDEYSIGVVIVHPSFIQGTDQYPEHGMWVQEKLLEPAS
uniref:Uncharacterized protein n=1 Tax=viral metagenome TaxID=1070528 RepID=A0A6M3JFE6_9ZZZZ